MHFIFQAARLQPVAASKVPVMQKSDVIEIDGIFVGTAIARSELDERLFFAIDARLQSMHGQVLPNLAELKLQVRRQFHQAAATPP